MTEQKKELLFEELDKCELFKFLGIRYGTATVDAEDLGLIWTRSDLNHAVGFSATEYDVDIATTGMKFIQTVGERLVPNMTTIAKMIRAKKLPGDLDMVGYSCKRVGEANHLHFYNSFNAQSPAINCLADAISTVSGQVERGMSAEVGTKLLQDALATDILIDRPKSTGMPEIQVVVVKLPVGTGD